MRLVDKKPSILIILSLWGLILLSSCTTVRFTVDSSKLDTYIQTSTVFAESYSGLAVYDMASQEYIYEYQADKRFIPASNTKLLTWFASSEMLEDSIPSIQYCVVNDSLYFTGTGDPTWFYSTYNHNEAINLLTNHKGTLCYVPRPMVDQRFGEGWAWDDYSYAYSVEKASFPIYGNRIYVAKRPGKTIPVVHPASFGILITTINDTTIDDYELVRKEQSNDFILRIHSDTVSDEAPFMYSDELLINMLADTLNRSIHLAARFPDCDKETINEILVDSVLFRILQESDNFLAEQMLLVISGTMSDTLSSRAAIKQMLLHQMSDVADDIKWIDGSGLSRYNLMTPRSYVMVLDKIYMKFPVEKIYAMLPESGQTGTLTNSFKSLSGSIHAKSGSMSGVYNLSGFLTTKSGKTLAFSFMNNNFKVPIQTMKQEMEKVLTAFMNY